MVKDLFDRESCLAALRGHAVPKNIKHPLHRYTIVSGIRKHTGFGEELRGSDSIFTRALNARSIMSNHIPDIFEKEDFPYCIWYPETASEDTYRQLIGRYPQMAYHVGRACAVAGYTKLYEELQLQPDVHIAEEARESGNEPIFNLIMSQPACYSIMDDYTRTVSPTHRVPVHLNGDTAVRWVLEEKQGISQAYYGEVDEDSGEFEPYAWQPRFPGFRKLPFNITEDMSLAEEDVLRKDKYLPGRLEIQLLSAPLPVDLPTVQKDLLILMAAYNGDIDRYSRLRRPVRDQIEEHVICRGIQHHTWFALWWRKQLNISSKIQEAINARMIMNNVLEDAPYEEAATPYQIWKPSVAQETTYAELVKVQPNMISQVMEAVIFAGYRCLFDSLLLDLVPNEAMLAQACFQQDKYYETALKDRLSTLGVDAEPEPYKRWSMWKNNPLSWRNRVEPYLDARTLKMTFTQREYSGRLCAADILEFNACVPETWRAMVTHRGWGDDLDYEEWPLAVLRGQSQPA